MQTIGDTMTEAEAEKMILQCDADGSGEVRPESRCARSAILEQSGLDRHLRDFCFVFWLPNLGAVWGP